MNIIFDLDGTLIDSSKGILQAVEMAFKYCKIEMQIPLNDELVGPPLTQLLIMLSGTENETVIAQLADEFKRSYDTEGYKETTIFDDIEFMLSELYQRGFKLFIATNKRKIPTEKILAFFGWSDFFEGVYALDACEQAINKSELISYVLKEHQLDTYSSIYVGDTIPDRLAATVNGLEFVMVSWGYEFKVDEGDHYVDSASQLLAYLNQAKSSALT
ncbi:MAG TPA: HAD family hydrolase [Methylophaga aminisulfidivorans]|uniref:HAD family hydrolase n=1 Tax=Methylophaga aminisulfidivorans TaxID=230105 RepID=A0A7C1VQS4_9GAMM|nr:HAD family hydrolase [Methylophaga aminisulfidivorans]